MNIPVLKTQYGKINNLLHISYLPKIINASIDINLFDILNEDCHTLDSIVSKLKSHKPVTGALINVLISIGLIVGKEDKYQLTDVAKEYLVKKSEVNQLHAVKRFSGSTGPFDYLPAALKGEVPEFDGKMWSSKEASLSMEQGMKAGGLQGVISFVNGIPEFASCTKMCDLAGNIGYFSYAFLQENPNLTAHVYDLPTVCQNAKELKQNDKDFSRVVYHEFDIEKDELFGEGYDFFFCSHFLYEFATNGALAGFLKKVNQSMKPDGIFVSNHIGDKPVDKESNVTLSLVELQTRIMGYPTHQMPESILITALTEAGFGEFRTQQPDGTCAFSTLLLSAKKIA